jgi:hypothetical protein
MMMPKPIASMKMVTTMKAMVRADVICAFLRPSFATHPSLERCR